MGNNEQDRTPDALVFSSLSLKHGMVSAVLIISSIIAAAVCMIILGSHGKNPSSGEFYPDLVSGQGSTCWEANVFASKYDPFYKWTQSSSLAAAFKNIAVERVSIAYQRLSVWRVSSNRLKKGDRSTTMLFNSPDPHLLGGVIQYDRNWISKMTINWGLSMRLCVHIEPGHVDNSCLKTTPIVWTGENEFSALMVEVPYRKASSSSFSPMESPFVSYGTYLTNLASSARRDVCLNINKTSNQGAPYWKYIYRGKPCKRTSPILYSPDVISYLAYPSLQCGCVGDKVCLIGLHLTFDNATDQNFSFKLNTTACESSNSFWHLLDPVLDSHSIASNVSLGTNLIFHSYSSKFNLSLSLNVSFNYSREDLEKKNWEPLLNLSSCIIDWVDRHQVKPVNATGLPSQCSQPYLDKPIAPLTERDVFYRYQIVHYKSSLVDQIVPVEVTDDIYCGISRGQVDRDSCVLELHEMHTQKEVKLMVDSLESFARVADIKQFSRMEWKKGSSRRSEVSIEIATTLLAFVVSVMGMLSKRMHKVEDMVVNSTRGFRGWIDGTIGMPVLRTVIRSSVIVTTAAWSLFELYKSIEDIESKVPQLATSETILQQSNGISFLVTTTSSIQVSPKWFSFDVLCSLMGVVLVAVLVYVYGLMVSIEPAISREGTQL